MIKILVKNTQKLVEISTIYDSSQTKMHPYRPSLTPWPVEANLALFPKNISEVQIMELQHAHVLCASFSNVFVAERINMLRFRINVQLIQLLNHYINVQLIQ